MQGKVISLVFAAASLVAAVAFGGVKAAQQQPEPPVLEQPPQTAPQTQPTLPPTEPTVPTTEPDVFLTDRLALSAAGSGMEAAHIFVYDCEAGEMLFCSTGEEESLYPASITKLFTAYVALKLLPPETVVTVGDELSLVQPGSSTAFLAQGHRLTAEMLVQAMLLPSGNDAAYVLSAAAGRQIVGEGTAPSEAVAAFVEEMNRHAQLLGMKNTHFSNPDGYHRDDHVSTPSDLAKLGTAAAENELIRRYCTLFSDAVRFKSGHTITWYNTNRLANPGDTFYEPAMLAGKTGYTRQAGYCLLSVVENQGRRLLVGIFGASDKTRRYTYAHALLDSLGL